MPRQENPTSEDVAYAAMQRLASARDLTEDALKGLEAREEDDHPAVDRLVALRDRLDDGLTVVSLMLSNRELVEDEESGGEGNDFGIPTLDEDDNDG